MSVQYFFVILINLLWLSSAVFAQDSTMYSQSSGRQFDEQAIRAYQNEREFDYQRVGRRVELSPLERFERWLDELLWHSLNTPEKRQNWRTGLYIFCAVTLTYIILRLLKVDLTQVFYQSKKTKQSWQLEHIAENFEQIDFNQLKTQALAEQDYNEALRWQYLGQLQILNQQAFIRWEKNKTNRDYWRELKASEARQAFATLNRWFDYVHYGDFQLNNEDFAQAEQDFKTFQQILKIS